MSSPTMSDKEALERLKHWLDCYAKMSPDSDEETFIADLSWLIAEREGLEARIAAMEQVTVGPLSYTAMRCRAEAAESKLSALEEAAEQVCIAFGMGWDMDGTIDALRALLHPAVPVETKPGFGWKLSDEGKAALDALDQAQAAGVRAVLEHPEHFIVGAAAPVQDAAPLCSDCPPVGYITDKTRCLSCPRRAALSPPVPPSQGAETVDSELAAADNNHKALVEALADHWLSQIVCDHAAKTDVAYCACGEWSSGAQPSIHEAAKRWAEHALAAFQSRQEEGS